ncbi:hypothetical protein [Clostridium estertheticum]|nr:hypothetical protein [Clostridium estertheticum]MBW9154061.1 hypothetical protein [Clostridium estertheticum]
MEVKRTSYVATTNYDIIIATMIPYFKKIVVKIEQSLRQNAEERCSYGN